MSAEELYAKAADLFREHVPWSWTSIDELVIRLENRSLFDMPGFFESSALRKTLVYQALTSRPASFELGNFLMAYGMTTMVRRI